MQRIDGQDIQGLVRHGYPYFGAACYELLEIQDVGATRRWLDELLKGKWIDDALTRAAELLDKNAAAEQHCGVAIAFTASGLRKLGLAPDALRTFVGEFQEGMDASHRARLLGDVGTNRPDDWRWGGPNNPRPDILLMIFAFANELDDRVQDIRGLAGYPHRIYHICGTRDDKEPFGFADGISQPPIEGLDFHRAGMTNEAPAIKTGEFVLGYPDEFGQLPASPSVARGADPRRMLTFAEGGRADFGRNGSFLVLRQLEQDVEAFRKLDPKLAARMIGRWPSGAALVQYPEQDPTPPGMLRNRAELAKENEFSYRRDDPHGFRCPLGSHARRANPRDSLAGKDLDPTTARDMSNRHRILRRGRRYLQDGAEGIMFLCLNANIERQYEFVQRTWIMNPEFHGLRAEGDPLLGGATGTQSMTVQAPWANSSHAGLGQYITVRGGGYFFLPGLAAIGYLAKSVGAPRQSSTAIGSAADVVEA